MLYMKVQVEKSLLNLKWPKHTTTPITYCNQTIPSPPNMLPYEISVLTPIYLYVMNTNNEGIYRDMNIPSTLHHN